jgi:hypothetical protein
MSEKYKSAINHGRILLRLLRLDELMYLQDVSTNMSPGFCQALPAGKD